MQLLSFNFFLYSVGGIWRPIEWSSSCAKFLYSVFTVCTIVPLYFLMLTQFVDTVFIVDNVDDFTNNSLMLVTVMIICCKATIVVLRRSSIIDLVEMLLSEPYKPRDEEELAIQARFDRFIRSFSMKYTLFATSSLTSVTLRSVLYIIQGHLPYRVWLPYDCNKFPIFLITSIHQIISIIFGTFINIGTDTLIFGLFLQTCAQCEIFEWRLHKFVTGRTTAKLASAHRKCFSAPSTSQRIIAGYIRHHLNIYEYAKTVNNVFNQVLFVQFFGSVLTICTSVYYLSSHIMESEAATLLIYTSGMFIQIFIYCWSGNEVMLKSMDVGDSLYHMDWPVLMISEKKDLLMIMRYSSIPIKFTSSFLITLSLQSYGNILKTSYSVFNILQQS